MPAPDEPKGQKVSVQHRNKVRDWWVSRGGEAADFNDKVAEAGGLGTMTNQDLIDACNALINGI